MLFKFELKKLFIKQHALVLIIFVAIVKIFNSLSLFSPDYSVLSKDQQNYYLNYISQYGGLLTDEKEDVILDLYERACDANALRMEIETDYNAGAYESDKEYMEALSHVPEIAGEYEAIKYLYGKYVTVAEDKENRALLAGDAKAMTVGAEYLLVILICFMSAATVFYERKINRLVKTTISAESSAAMRAASLFLAVFSAWLIFAGIEFAATVYAVSADNLGVSAVSLDSFQNTPYMKFSILQMFVLIELTKLCGYLLISSVTIITTLVIKNLPLAIFIPFACTFVWIYLFGSGNITYCSPFSLILGSPYYTGDFYLRESGVNILLYNAVPLPQTLLLVAVCVAITAAAFFVMIGKNRGAKKLSAAFAAVSVCLLCGCSRNIADDGIYEPDIFNIVSDGEYYYALSDVTDEYGMLLERHLTVFDSEMNIVNQEIDLSVMENSMCYNIQLSGEYLYCQKSLNTDYITRINLNDFHEETVYTQPDQQGRSAYLDLLTVWPNRNDIVGRINEWFVCGEEIYIFTSENKAFRVRNGRSSYLFEDLKINYPSMKSGKIYYLNANGFPVCYDGEKTVMSERSFYGAQALDDGFYCYNDSGIYKIDYNDFFVEKYCENPPNIIALYGDGILRRNGNGDYVFVDRSGNERVYNVAANEYNIAFIDGDIFVSNNNTLERRDYRTNEEP